MYINESQSADQLARFIGSKLDKMITEHIASGRSIEDCGLIWHSYIYYWLINEASPEVKRILLKI